MSAHVNNVTFLNCVEWPENVAPIGPTRGEDDTTMRVFGRYPGPTVGVPC